MFPRIPETSENFISYPTDVQVIHNKVLACVTRDISNFSRKTAISFNDIVLLKFTVTLFSITNFEVGMNTW